MKLPQGQREKLFHEGRALSALLGDAFQNEVSLTVSDMDAELKAIAALTRQLDTYRANVVFIRDIDMDAD